ncbi:MAG TPA: AMP-binding protein, partial [Bryobacterales bacterium]|nr:AMP-binding protein [Bryobacterales bacterium]
LTHANLLANIRAIGQALNVGPEDRGVSWLPLYHDMGLIGCWLLSLYFGMPLLVLSPLDFLSRPERWLWAIHYHRATLSVAPNFAYDLCARKIRDESIEGLDLSCWRAAMNGSEMVRPQTIARFTARFSRCGFRPEAMLPVYGLAESTVALCVPPLERGPRLDHIRRQALERQQRAEPAVHDHGGSATLTFVSVGRPLPGHALRIVDEAGQEVGERIEGSIQFRGPSSMAGYFRQPEATAAITRDGWLDSGDLGYWAGGELFVTGRSKDIILKAGRNLYPDEIEAAVEEVDGLRKGCVAAFGTADPAQGSEKLVVVAETREQSAPVRDRLRGEVTRRLMDALGVPPDDVLLLDPGLLPKTSSGKLRRAVARHAYEKGAIARGRPPMIWQWLRLSAGWARHSMARVGQATGRLVCSAYFYALFLALLLACRLAMIATPAGARSAALLRSFTLLFLRLAGLQIKVEGVEHLGAGPQVLVSNHASYVDVLALNAALPGYFCYVAKKELLGVPVIGGFIRKIGYLVVDRYSTAQGAADA